MSRANGVYKTRMLRARIYEVNKSGLPNSAETLEFLGTKHFHGRSLHALKFHQSVNAILYAFNSGMPHTLRQLSF